MKQSDRDCHTAFFIYDRLFQRCDSGVAGQVSLAHRRCVVDDHARVVEQTLDDVHGVLWRMEVLFQLDDGTVKECQGNIVPAVDVDLFKVGRAEKRSQDAVFCHLAVELIDQLPRGHSFHLEVVISQILIHVSLEL